MTGSPVSSVSRNALANNLLVNPQNAAAWSRRNSAGGTERGSVDAAVSNVPFMEQSFYQ
jgi:hypothetical protein